MAALAVYCLLLAVAPTRRAARAGLDLIRASTEDRLPVRATEAALARSLLRRLTVRLGVGARWVTAQELVEAGIDPDRLPPAEVTTAKLLGGALAGAVAVAL